MRIPRASTVSIDQKTPVIRPQRALKAHARDCIAAQPRSNLNVPAETRPKPSVHAISGLANITSQVKLNESQINKLERDIDERIAAAAELERRGTEPPEEIQNAIESLRSQIARKRTFIENKLVEQVQVRDKFDADIGRFRELKGGDY